MPRVLALITACSLLTESSCLECAVIRAFLCVLHSRPMCSHTCQSCVDQCAVIRANFVWVALSRSTCAILCMLHSAELRVPPVMMCSPPSHLHRTCMAAPAGRKKSRLRSGLLRTRQIPSVSCKHCALLVGVRSCWFALHKRLSTRVPEGLASMCL